MANTSSAKKMVRKIAARTEVNRQRRSRVRRFVRKVEEAIRAGDASVAREALRSAESEMARAVGKGVFHRNMASRKISRLNAAIQKIAA